MQHVNSAKRSFCLVISSGESGKVNIIATYLLVIFCYKYIDGTCMKAKRLILNLKFILLLHVYVDLRLIEYRKCNYFERRLI